jgi:hypothetical protein
MADEFLSSAVPGSTARNDAKGVALDRVMGAFIDPTPSWPDISRLHRCAPGALPC